MMGFTNLGKRYKNNTTEVSNNGKMPVGESK